MSYLNNKRKYTVKQRPTKENDLAEVQFEDYQFSSYLTEVDFRELELGQKLQKKLSSEEIELIVSLISDKVTDALSDVEME